MLSDNDPVKTVRLTRRAESRLEDIAAWTISHFGADQAQEYEKRLINRLHDLAVGELPRGRPCDLLVQGLTEATDLHYIQEGGHFIIYRQTAKEIHILDFIHGARDIKGILKDLAAPF